MLLCTEPAGKQME